MTRQSPAIRKRKRLHEYPCRPSRRLMKTWTSIIASDFCSIFSTEAVGPEGGPPSQNIAPALLMILTIHRDTQRKRPAGQNALAEGKAARCENMRAPSPLQHRSLSTIHCIFLLVQSIRHKQWTPFVQCKLGHPNQCEGLLFCPVQDWEAR